MRYLLDANVVLGFLRTGHATALVQLAKPLALGVLEEVRDEIELSKAKLPKTWWNTSGIVIHEIKLGSQAHATYAALAPPTIRGRGERASIALAVHDNTFIFVTNDGGAARLALRELRGARVESLASFLFAARDRLGLSWNVVDAVYAEGNTTQPSWWATWRATK